MRPQCALVSLVNARGNYQARTPPVRVHTQIVRPQWKRRLWTRVGHTARRAWNLGIKVIPLAVFELQDALPFPLSPGRKLASVVGIVVWSTEALAEEAQDHVQFLYTCMRTCA